MRRAAASAAFLTAALLLAGAARLEDGRIRRDAATEAAIAATAGVRLKPSVPRRLAVDTGRYCLEVREGERAVKVFPVAFGSEPGNPKVRQGDGRTPHGTYKLVPHHPSPAFGACFYICYPGPDDVRRGLTDRIIDAATARRLDRALARGGRPPHETGLGGLILLHGTRDRAARGLTDTNWTLGCIAMENEHLLEILALYRASDRPELTIGP